MLTKKNFEAIAAILKPFVKREYKHDEDELVKEIIGDLVTYLRKENPLFDTIRFLKACGIGQ